MPEPSDTHNAVVADVKDGLGTVLAVEEVFAEAQRIVRWHYQWMIVHEFLPKTVGAATMTDIVTHGRKFYAWRHDPYIPVEFSVAAYRFGHSQVRPSYRANFGTSASDVGQQFFAIIFDHTHAVADDPGRVVVYDVPLLVEARGTDGFDVVVVVDAPRALRLRRLVELRGMSDEEARRRVDAQADDRSRLAVADLVVDSSGSLEETLRQADDLYDELRSLSAVKQAASRDASVGGPS